MPISRLVETIDAIEYLGDNAQEIVAAAADSVSTYQFVIISESGGQAEVSTTLYGNTNTLTWNIGDWIRVDTLGPFRRLSDDGGLGKYVVVEP